MTETAPLVGKLTVPGVGRASVSELVSEISAEYSLGQVAELTVTVVDPFAALPIAPLVGAAVSFDGASWKVGAVDGEELEWGFQLVMRCREPLAKAMRRTYRTGASKDVSPGEWIASRVRDAGGVAVVQRSSKKATIAQSKDQTVLDVVESLASESDWVWTSYDGRFLAGTRWAFYGGEVGSLPMWPVTWMRGKGSDAVSLQWFVSDDNTDSSAEIDVTLPYEQGVGIRPLHRLKLTGSHAAGVYVVESVAITHDGSSPVQVRASRPTRPRGKAGSVGAR